MSIRVKLNPSAGVLTRVAGTAFFLAGAGTIFWSGSGSYSYSTVNILFFRDPKYDYDDYDCDYG